MNVVEYKENCLLGASEMLFALPSLSGIMNASKNHIRLWRSLFHQTVNGTSIHNDDSG